MNLIDDIIHVGRTYGWGLALTIFAGALLAWVFRIGTYNAVRALREAIDGMATVGKEQDKLRAAATMENKQLKEDLRIVRRDNSLLHKEIRALRADNAALQKRVDELERIILNGRK